MDNLTYWNVRGMNTPNKQKEIKLLCNKENIGIVGLLGVFKNLYHHYDGRVWITRRPDCLQVVLISRTAQPVTCHVNEMTLKASYLLTVANAFNTKDEKRSLWEYLEELSLGVNMPLIVTGDFNSVLKFEDRVGGN